MEGHDAKNGVKKIMAHQVFKGIVYAAFFLFTAAAMPQFFFDVADGLGIHELWFRPLYLFLIFCSYRFCKHQLRKD